MRRYRRQLYIIENKNIYGIYSVGYWDRKKNIDPDRDFRCLCTCYTYSEAEAYAEKISKDKDKEFKF